MSGQNRPNVPRPVTPQSVGMKPPTGTAGGQDGGTPDPEKVPEGSDSQVESTQTEEKVLGAPLPPAPEVEESDAAVRAALAQATNKERLKVALSTSGRVRVYPVKSVPRVRIGNIWYSFTARQVTDVPKDIVGILVEKGIVVPTAGDF